ncbi:MAG: DUF3179 domain-containing (seleno)protein [Planctomycetota bacterium]|jgi:hypothetical protein
MRADVAIVSAVLLMICASAIGLVDCAVLADVAAHQDEPDSFELQNWKGGVDLDATFDMRDLRIPRDEIHELIPKDAIMKITDPKLEPGAGATWLNPGDRIMAITVNGETVGVPLKILAEHEVFNMKIGGEPVAATFCPLCDSTTAFSRRVVFDSETHDLDFGIAGALYNSNMILYDSTTNGLWSQLALEAVSGPLSGTSLRHLPMRIMPWMQFKLTNPSAMVVSNDTGFDHDYSDPGSDIRNREGTMVPVRGIGNALTNTKTLGAGIRQGDMTWFVSLAAIGEVFTLETPIGPVVIRANEDSIHVDDAPEGTITVQTMYYAWSAFYPSSDIIATPGERGTASPE